MLYLISGDGRGAGKTTLARNLVDEDSRYSLANLIRAELTDALPAYDWYATDQAYKDQTSVPEWGSVSVRDVMVKYGQDRCKESPTYWVDALIEEIHAELVELRRIPVVVVDDVRKVLEVERLREWARGWDIPVTHFHVINPLADDEPFANDDLRGLADYLITWQGVGNANP